MPAGASSCPTYLSRDGATLYFGYGFGSSGASKVGSLDLSGTGTVTADLVTGGYSGAPRVAAGGGHLVTGDVGFAGDGTYAASSASSTVTVARPATALAVRTDKAAYPYGAKATITAQLGTVHDGRSVCFYATPYAGTRTLIRCTTATSAGVATATYTTTKRTTLTASYAGDQWYNPVSAARTVTAAARVDGALTGYYKKSGSTYYYRTKTDPNLVARVLPNYTGSCVRFTAQAYVKGAWHTGAIASCLRLDRNSLTAARMYGSRPTSVPFRMQAVFTGDTANTSAASSWYNFRFTR